MKKNLLKEIDRVKEIMGLEIIQEQVQSPPYDLYTQWKGTDGGKVITSKEWSDKKIFKAGFINYIGPFGNRGYVVLMPRTKYVDGIGEISSPVVNPKYPP